MLAKYGYAVLQGATLFKRKWVTQLLFRVYPDEMIPANFPSRFPNTPTDTLLSLRRSQSDPLRRSCPNRGVPDCPAASLRYRTSDGSCNNLKHLWWGSAMSTMERWFGRDASNWDIYIYICKRRLRDRSYERWIMIFARQILATNLRGWNSEYQEIDNRRAASQPETDKRDNSQGQRCSFGVCHSYADAVGAVYRPWLDRCEFFS